MLALPNVIMRLLNVRKKNAIECEKGTIKCDVGTAQYDNGTIEKKK